MTEETGRYKTPGELIQAAREERGAGLEDIAAATRIPVRMLQAIEEDDFQSLSGPLYVRSFLKSLSTELDLDAALLLERYEGLAGEPPGGGPEAGPAEGTWETETRVQRVDGRPGRALVIGVAVALVAVVAAVFALRGRGGEEAVPEPTPRPVVADTVDTVSEIGSTAEAPEGVGPEGAGDTSTPDAGGRLVSPPPEVLDAVAGLPIGGPDLVFGEGVRWPLVLRIVMEEPLDLAVTADGDSVALDWDAAATGVPEEGLTSGRLYRVGGRHVLYVGARDHFMLRLGAAEGVAVTLNNELLEIPTRIVGHDWWLDRARIAEE